LLDKGRKGIKAIRVIRALKAVQFTTCASSNATIVERKN